MEVKNEPSKGTQRISGVKKAGTLERISSKMYILGIVGRIPVGVCAYQEVDVILVRG